jgi:tetratricopeptide (TPR) repeat protein
MAKLYGRVPRLPDTKLIGLSGVVLGVVCSLFHAEAIRADNGFLISGAPSSDEISQWAQELLNSQAARREKAYKRLTTLERDTLPSIAQRLDELSRSRPKPDRVVQLLTAIRHAVGSRRADDIVDIAPGVLTLLEQNRSRTALKVVEPLLLLRSLEGIGTREAGTEVIKFMDFDQGAWRHELKCARSRMGIRLLPVLIEMRGHENAKVRRWAVRGIRVLGMKDPSVAVRIADHHLVAKILLAYANPLDFSALPVIVSSMNSDKMEIRNAARQAITRFGKNAIWPLREAFEEATGRRSRRDWNWERLPEELNALQDRERKYRADDALKKGIAAFRAFDFKTMARHFDQILADYPDYEKRSEMAPGYAAMGQKYLNSDDLAPAMRAYRRAIRLSPTHSAVSDWRAQLAFVTSEQQLSRGVANLEGYKKVLQHDPEHKAAETVIDRISGAWEMRQENAKRWSKIGAVILLSLFALGQFYRRSRRECNNA